MKSVIFILLILTGKLLMADETPSSHPNPYVDLYLQRVIEAEAAHKKNVALVNLALAKLNIAKKVLEKRAMSQEEYLEKEATYEVAVAAVSEAEAAIAEAKSLYRLALVRTEAGQDMPICLR